jgi:succinoglycan biosynthesis protein ExoA
LADFGRVSVMAPMLNEAAHIEHLVADIAAQDFEGEIEILVADGGSTDGSVERLQAAADRNGVAVTVLANRDRWVAPALNACIQKAKGDLLVRVDCHTRYPADYIRKLAAAAEETGAWCVGGVVVPIGHTPTERAVACATASPFGGVHWSRRDRSAERVEVDTVYCGAFRAEAFRQAGLYDQSLVRNQDDEFSLRLRRAGGRVVLDPSIRAYYTPRGSYRGAFRQYYEYGFWKVAVMKKHGQIVSFRSLIPLAFVGSIGAFALAGVYLPRMRQLLAAEVTAYACSAIGFGAASVRRRRESWRLLPRVVAVFPTYHVAYGIGLLHGVLSVAQVGNRKDLRSVFRRLFAA